MGSASPSKLRGLGVLTWCADDRLDPYSASQLCFPCLLYVFPFIAISSLFGFILFEFGDLDSKLNHLTSQLVLRSDQALILQVPQQPHLSCALSSVPFSP